MQQISRFAGLVTRALFLRTDAYEEMREARNPFVEGLFIIVIIGVIIAVAGVVGTTLEWASSPDGAALQDILYDGLTNMPWYQMLEQEIGREFTEQFQWQWNLNSQIARWAAPTPLSSLAGVVTTPLWLIIGWLIYGLLAHLFARLLGGEASLSQTLGCTALAVTPQVLNLAGLLPSVAMGGVVATWTLICRYVALKQAHRFTWGRAFWATVLPRLALWLLLLIATGMAAVIFSALVP
jgi:hypothetical protein